MPFGGLLTVAGIGTFGQLLAGWLGSNAADKAAGAQAVAGTYAADLQRQAEREALLLQLGIYEQTRADQMPWLQAGRGGVNRLSQLLGVDTYTAAPQPSQVQMAQQPDGSFAPANTDAPQSQTQIPAGLTYEQFKAIASQYDHGTMPADSPLMDSFYRRQFDQYTAGTPAYYPTLFNPGEGGTQPAGTRPPGSSPAYTTPLTGDQLQPQNVSYTTDPRSGDFGELTQGFNAPAPFRFDASQVGEDPGYLFRLKEGQRALERSAASKGAGLGGGVLRALTEYGQEMGSQEYDKAYGRRASEYDRDFSNSFNVFNTNATNKFNRLAALAGVGQVANTTLANVGQNYAANAGNTIMQTGQNVGELQTQIGNARASGYVGGANAWGGALGNIAQMGTDLYGLNRRYR